MLSKTRSCIVLFVLGSIAILGCGDDDPTGPAKIPNSIVIKSVTPSSGLGAGVATEFDVAVEYTLASADSGELYIGFNNVLIDKYNIVSSANTLVANGSAEHLFNVTVVTKNWGSEGDFSVYVNLSEHPHGPQWTPLATDTRVLTFE